MKQWGAPEGKLGSKWMKELQCDSNQQEYKLFILGRCAELFLEIAR